MPNVSLREIQKILDNSINEIYMSSGDHPLDREYITRLKEYLLTDENISVERRNFEYTILSLLNDTVQYISFQEFYDALTDISDDLKQLLLENRDRKIVFVPGNGNLSKSNFWVMLLVLDICRDFFENNEDITDNISVTDPEDPVCSDELFVYFDDGAYSGSQMMENITQYDKTCEFFVFCPYFSVAGKTKMQTKRGVKILGGDKTHLLRSVQDLLQEWIENNHGIFDFLNYDENDFIDTVYSNRYSVYPGHILAYFDHKLADSVSIPELLFKTGKTSSEGYFGEKSLIKNCGISLFAEKECPRSLYKNTKYRYNDEIVGSVSDVRRILDGEDYEVREETKMLPEYDYKINAITKKIRVRIGILEKEKEDLERTTRELSEQIYDFVNLLRNDLEDEVELADLFEELTSEYSPVFPSEYLESLVENHEAFQAFEPCILSYEMLIGLLDDYEKMLETNSVRIKMINDELESYEGINRIG